MSINKIVAIKTLFQVFHCQILVWTHKYRIRFILRLSIGICDSKRFVIIVFLISKWSENLSKSASV